MPPAALGPINSAAQLAADNRSPENIRVAHWHQSEIDYLRWDQSFPYQILVVRQERGGAWRQLDDWLFTLPIPPNSLRIQTPIPTDLLLNEDGSVELVNDIRVRMISLQGTTGVLPLRPVARFLPFSATQTILAGNASRQFSSMAARGFAAAQPYLPQNVITDDELLGDVGRTSGYAQFLLLEQFFERFFVFKKTAEGRDCRLALAIWKSKQVWLLSLQQFDLARIVPQVYSYPYSLAGKSDGRISLEASPPAFEQPPPLSSDPATLASTLSAISSARGALAQHRDLIATAAGDAVTLAMEPARELSLLLNDMVGASLSMADLPLSIVAASKGAIVSMLSSRSGLEGLPGALERSAAVGSELDEVRALGALLARSDTRTAQLLASGPLANAPANSIFEEPDRHLDFFAAIKPGDLQLPSSVVSSISKERARVTSFTRADYARRRAGVQLLSDRLAASVGLSSATYQRTAGLDLPPQVREATDDDFEALFALNQLVMTLDSLAARAPRESDATAAAMQYVAGLAADAGINMRVPRSKLPVPFPHGMTLEQVARMYMPEVDPDEGAQELITLNNLREPFVDEVGWIEPLIATPLNDQVFIGSRGEELVVGQAVSILARDMPELAAVVVQTERIGSNWLVTLSVRCTGYRISSGASLHAYAPGTVHGGQIFWIPSSEEPAQDDFTVSDPTAPADELPLMKVSGTDFLLTQTGDLVITPDGDFLYARGLALVTQAVRTAMATPRGSLLRHPSFGLPEIVGSNSSQVGPLDVTKAIRETFQNDPLFRGVDGVAVEQVGPTMTVGVAMSVAGTNRSIPLSVQLRQI